MYYPSVVPPVPWMKQSLLYYDMIGSVAPNGFLDSAPKDIRSLVDRGLYEPIHGDQMPRSAVLALADDVFQVLVEQDLAEAPKRLDYGVDNTLNYGKLPATVEELLLELGAARHANSRLLLRGAILNPLVCLLAKHATAAFSANDRQYSMHTLAPSAQGLAMDPLSTASGPTQFAVALTIRGVLPVPGPAVAWDQILRFRDDNRASLLRLRSSVESLMSDLAARGEPDSKKKALLSAEIEEERATLTDRMRSLAWEIASVATVATCVAAGGAALAPVATPWILGGIGTAVLTAVNTHVRGGPKPKYQYLHRAQAAFG